MEEKKWTVYVDETYLTERDGLNNDYLVTAFFAIPEKYRPKMESEFQKEVYRDGGKREKKSNRMSDQRLHSSLLTLENKNAHFFISRERLSEFSCKYKETKLLHQFHGYLFPLRHVLRAIAIDSASAFLVEFKFDTENLLLKEQGKLLSIIDKIVFDVSKETKKKIRFTFAFLDSSESFGIQAADFLCGAYRKEYLYHFYDQEERIIPFDYQLLNSEKNPKLGDELALLLGRILLYSDKRLRTYYVSPEERTANKGKDFGIFKGRIANLLRVDMEKLIARMPLEDAQKSCQLMVSLFQVLRPEYRWLNQLSTKQNTTERCVAVVQLFQKNIEQVIKENRKVDFSYEAANAILKEIAHSFYLK